jgi:C1A family cysteine protease
MKTIAIIAIAASLAATLFVLYPSESYNADAEFLKFVQEHSKSYTTESEYTFRQSLFANNLKIVEEHNAKGKSWTLGVNEFSDWTDAEYKQMLGYKPALSNPQNDETVGDFPVNCPTPDALKDIDWVASGNVTPVKNQGSCGSCWAFSAVGSLEGAYSKHFGELKAFSEQHLVACDKFSHGCQGGLMTNGFIHWMHNAPILEADYPYHIPDQHVCKEKEIATDIPELTYGYRVDIGWQCVWDAISHGVTSVAIRAENPEFRNYQSGIIDGEECGTDLDHGVTLVGYQKENDAWVIKNSWGANWGEEGFVRIKRAEDGFGICGINQQNAQATYDPEEWDHRH